MFSCQSCLNSAPKVILPELLQFALHPTWRGRIIKQSKQQEAFPAARTCTDLCLKKPKVTTTGRMELAKKCTMPAQMAPILQSFAGQASNVFWEFIHKYVSVLCCIDSAQHSRAELQHIWNDCLDFDSIITVMRKLFIWRYLTYRRQASSP